MDHDHASWLVKRLTGYPDHPYPGIPVPLGSPVFNLVTEGRYFPPRAGRGGYSSCGDLCHAVLFHLGFRDTWINRAEHNGWIVGKNLTLLTVRDHQRGLWGVNPVAQVPDPDFVFQPGDVAIVDARSPRMHGFVWIDPETGVTGDYGQPHGGWHRNRRTVATDVTGARPAIVRPNGRVMIIHSVIRLTDLARQTARRVAPTDPDVLDTLIRGRDTIPAPPVPGPGWPPGTRDLRRTDPSMRGPDVRCVQVDALLANGYALPRYGADSDYGDETAGAVRRYQADRGLKPDAWIGPKTWAVILQGVRG